MKIAITGGLGHIGSRVMRVFPIIFKDAEFLVVDNFETQRYVSLYNLDTATRKRTEFVECNILESDMNLLRGSDVVIHLASITDATASVGRLKERVMRENLEMTKRVATACNKNDIKMIFPSSTSVYGSQDAVVNEDSNVNPQSPYAETKVKEEDFVRSIDTLNSCIFRFGTISGISHGMRFHTAVNRFCLQAALGQPLTVWKIAFNQLRPYLSLVDAVEAMAFVIECKIFDGETYNCLTTNMTVKDVVDKISKFIPDLQINYVDHKIMNQVSYEVSSEKIKSKGFGFKGDIDADIEDTIKLLGAV
tara:strand:- start:390 stop:1307 length:918 start_codon:yes stop_codon:yes gene_type:complete